MWVPRRRGLVIPIITLGQSPEWMEIAECSLYLLVEPGDSPVTRELREKVGDLVFLSSGLMRGQERRDRLIKSLQEENAELRGALKQAGAAQRGLRWRR